MASPKNPLSYPICGVAATEEHSGVNCDDLLRAALASLQLPHMPINENLNSDEKRDGYVQATPLHSHSTPTVCILVVADVDLSSASALAEYALQQKRFGVFDASMIDLCIACGPFCRDDDLNEYRKGSLSNLSSKSSRRRKTPFQWRFENQELKSLNSDVDYSAGNDQDRSCDWTRTPFFRSNEENAALEGILTATLSQLESIVCRLVFCPGSSDPLTTFSPAATNQAQLKFPFKQYDRLTPNSRNINHLWLPLAPGLGCGGLFYMESINDLLYRSPSGTSTSKSYQKVSTSTDDYEYGDEADDDLSEIAEGQMSVKTLELLSHQVPKLGQSGKGYYPTLSRLLRLAAPNDSKTAASSTEIQFKATHPQSILVTHYVDSYAITTEVDNITDSKPTMPWPTKHDSETSSSVDREEFYESNNNLMCLEIASGSSHSNPAQWIQSPFIKSRPDLKANVLLPGSLRERGEFSLVHLGLVETCNESDANKKCFEWKVLNIDMHRLGEFHDE